MNTEIFKESERLSVELKKIIDLPLFESSARVATSDIACSMSLEHWAATRRILEAGLLPSGVVVHRAQFEALFRSIWLPRPYLHETLNSRTNYAVSEEI